MEAIKTSLEQFLREKNLLQKVSHHVDSLLEHPVLLDWLQKNPGWTKEDLLPAMLKIRQYLTENEQCSTCTGLKQCSNLFPGYYTQMFSYGKTIELEYAPCRYQLQSAQEKERKSLFKSHHIPKDILAGNFREFDRSGDGRIDACNAMLEFCLQANPGENDRGIYLYGPLGVGKSYLLGAACNELAKRGIASLMLYTPDFFREMKAAIAEQKVDDKLQALKEVPVLLFDDIGAENISAWARDEILGAILQYRVMAKLPTVYTSNYNYDQLEEHLAYSQKGGIEQLKAKRIMERIRHYTDAYFVQGPNRRIR